MNDRVEVSIINLHQMLKNNDVSKWTVQKLLYMETIKISTNCILYYKPLLTLILQYLCEYKIFIEYKMSNNGLFHVILDVNNTLPDTRNMILKCYTKKISHILENIEFVTVSAETRLCECCPYWKLLNKELFNRIDKIQNKKKFYNRTIGHLNFCNIENHKTKIVFDIHCQFYDNIIDL